MKYEWEESDCRAGRHVGKTTCSEQWMIGYVPQWDYQYVLVSLSDGMVCGEGLLKASLVEMLNENKYIPLTHS